MEGPKGSAAADIDLEMEVTISGGGGREEPRQFLERRWKGEEVGWRRCFCRSARRHAACISIASSGLPCSEVRLMAWGWGRGGEKDGSADGT
jgi:hypothetical protein